jgi:UrcA family protein
MKEMTAVLAVAAFALGNLRVAHGETNPQQRSETVKFADLDVNTERGATQLLARLGVAAGHVCRDPLEAHLADRRVQRMQCENRAIGAAVAAIDAPAVTALAREHGVEPQVPAAAR